MVLAIINSTTCSVLWSAQDAPPGAVVFSSPDELALALDRSTMDQIRLHMFSDAQPSTTKENAAVSLWIAMAATLNRTQYRQYAAIKNTPFKKKRKWEMIYIRYVPGSSVYEDYVHDHVLRRCARIMLDTVRGLGKRYLVATEVDEFVVATCSHLAANNSLGMRKAWYEYRSELLRNNMIEMMTFRDYASIIMRRTTNWSEQETKLLSPGS